MSGSGLADAARNVSAPTMVGSSGFEPAPLSGGLDSMGMLQAYRANPFSLATDMSRPAQFLPPALANFDYAAQAAQQKAAAEAAAQAAKYAQSSSAAPVYHDYGGVAGDSGAVGNDGGGVGGGGGGGGGK